MSVAGLEDAVDAGDELLRALLWHQPADEQAAPAEHAVGDRFRAQVRGGDCGEAHVVERGDAVGHLRETALDRICLPAHELGERMVPRLDQAALDLGTGLLAVGAHKRLDGIDRAAFGLQAISLS